MRDLPRVFGENSGLGTGVGSGGEVLTAYTPRIKLYSSWGIARHISATKLVYMVSGTKNHLNAGVLPLWNAVFCLDCEMITGCRGDECVACKSRSIVSLAQMLGGNLLAHRAERVQQGNSGSFDITMTVELRQMHARDLTITVERLSGVIGPQLGRDQASFHINVKPASDKLNLQPSLCFPERVAA